MQKNVFPTDSSFSGYVIGNKDLIFLPNICLLSCSFKPECSQRRISMLIGRAVVANCLT